MNTKKFTTELKESLNLRDFSIVRNLYTPLVGIEAVSLYELLADYQELNTHKRSFFSFSDLQKTLNLTFEEISQSKMKLEAVGLLRTFEKANNELFVFIINKPLSATAFRQNSLLYKQYIKSAGEEMFERIEFSNKVFINNKDDYKETTMKFQDMFDINFTKKQNTLEVKLPEALNKDDAMKSLTTMQFVKFLTNKTISPALMSIVQNLQKLGFSSRSINEISSYSYDVNGKIVARHVNVIANDLFEKNINSAEEIRVELSHAFESRNPGETSFLKEQNIVEQSELEWDDIFNGLGEL